MGRLLRSCTHNKCIVCILLIMVLMISYVVYDAYSPQIILRVTVHGWASFSPFTGPLCYTPYLAKIRSGQSFEIPIKWREVKIKLEEITTDTTAVISIDRRMSLAANALMVQQYTDNSKVGIKVGLKDVSFNTPSLDAGTEYIIRLDTSKTYSDIMKYRISNVVDITEFDNPKDWEFTEEVLHVNGKPKYQWREVFDKRFKKVKDGIFKEYYIYGQLLREIHYKNGALDGSYKEWSQNGELIISGSYKEGMKDGDWTFYDDNQKVIYTGNYNEGTGNSYYANGNQETQEIHKWIFRDSTLIDWFPIKYAARDSIWRKWYPDGQIEYETKYIDGKFGGFEREWYPNGQLKYEKIDVYDEEGKISTVRKRWLQSGQLTTEGSHSRYLPRRFGEFIDIRARTRHDNVHDSLSTRTFDNGQLRKQSYFDGSGYLTNIKGWLRSGSIEYEQFYNNGQKDKRITWHENGQMRSISYYKNGILDGKSTCWDRDGTLLYETIYEEGKAVHE